MVDRADRELACGTAALRVRRTLEDQRYRILAQSTQFIAALGAAIWITSEALPQTWIGDPAIHLAVAVILVIAFALSALAVTVVTLKIGATRRRRTDALLRPDVTAALAGIALGESRAGELRRLHGQAPECVESVLADFLMIQRGEGRRRLGLAAAEAGIVARWRTLAVDRRAEVRFRAITYLGLSADGGTADDLAAALRDREELVWIAAARGLLRLNDPARAEAVFADLPAHSAFVRALISPLLRGSAPVLANSAIPAALGSNDVNVVTATLDLIYDWKRALPVPYAPKLLTDPDPSVRSRAWRAVPYVLGASIEAQELARALESPEPEVRREAVRAAGRIKVADSGAILEKALFDTDLETAAAAAAALASTGLTDRLEAITTGGRYPWAGIAAEALEKLRTGRLIA